MKTNFFKSIVIMIVALLCGTTSANAQEKATFSPNDAAIMASLGNNQRGCSHDYYRFANGKLVEKSIDIHTGLKVELFGGYAGLSGTTANWPKQSDNSVSYGIALIYNHHKRNWLVDLMGRVYGEGNSRVTIEELHDRALMCGGEFYIGFNPCGSIRPYLGYGLDYIHGTSKTDIDEELYEVHIPWAGNAAAHGPRIRVEADIFSIKTSINDRGIKVTKKRSVSLVASGKYQWYQIEEPLGSTLKMQRWEVNLGIAVPLFF